MIRSLWLGLALCSTCLAAPTLPFTPIASALPAEIEALSAYFNTLGSEIETGVNTATAPFCDLSNAQVPVASPTALPGPSQGLTLKHVAIGRGTQNYSCSSDATAAPVQLGALATLYNASCIAADFPNLLQVLPNAALQFNLTGPDQPFLMPTPLSMSGHHFFENGTTPTFDLDTEFMELGFAPSRKWAAVPAPAGAPLGQFNIGNGAATWLALHTDSDATGNIKEVYRLNTAGGQAPATCAGMPALFEVQYAAEYWFWQS